MKIKSKPGSPVHSIIAVPLNLRSANCLYRYKLTGNFYLISVDRVEMGKLLREVLYAFIFESVGRPIDIYEEEVLAGRADLVKLRNCILEFLREQPGHKSRFLLGQLHKLTKKAIFHKTGVFFYL